MYSSVNTKRKVTQYIQNGRRTDLFYFLSRNIQFDDFIILIGMKLLVEDLQPTDSDYGKIFVKDVKI